MVFLFFAPFRTDFNLHSLEAIRDRETIVDVLVETVKVESYGSSGLRWLAPWDKEEKGELYYSELNEDFIPDSATPLLKLNVPAKYIKDNLGLRPEEDQLKGFNEYEVNQCSVSYYDNTVGILTLEVSFPERDEYESMFLTLDKWSTKMCSLIVELIQPHEGRILKRIHSIFKSKNKDVFLSPENFIVFFDRFELSNAKNNRKRERMLWVTRISVGYIDDSQSKVLEKWTQCVNLSENSLSLEGSEISACVGNSVVRGALSKENKYALETALQVSTYFYVLYEVFNKVLRLLYLDMSNVKKNQETTISRVNRVRAHIEFMENEFGDALAGLQGSRSAITNKFMEAWSYSDLVGSVQRKKESVGRFSESILSERHSKYGRVVEAFLAAIGGVSLLDFILSLFTFANDKRLNSDTIPGLVDSAKYMPVDGVLYGAMALLIFVLILVLRKR